MTKNKNSNNNNKKSNNNKGDNFDDILNFINGDNTVNIPITKPIDLNENNNTKQKELSIDEKLKIVYKLFDEYATSTTTPAKSTPTPTFQQQTTVPKGGKALPKQTSVPKSVNKTPTSITIPSDITFLNNAKNYYQLIKEKNLTLESLLKLNKIIKPTTNTINKSSSSSSSSTTTTTTQEYYDPKKIKNISDEESSQVFKLFDKTKNECAKIFIAFQFFIFIQIRGKNFNKEEYSGFVTKLILDESPLINGCAKRIINYNEIAGKVSKEVSECNSEILKKLFNSQIKENKLNQSKDGEKDSESIQLFKENIQLLLNLFINSKDSSNAMNLLASVLFYQKVFEGMPPTSMGQYYFLEYYYNQLKNGLTLSTYYCDVVDKKIEELQNFNHLINNNNNNNNNNNDIVSTSTSSNTAIPINNPESN